MADMTSLEGFMEDPQGRLVPLKLVSDYDKLKDQLVRELADKAKEIRDILRGFKAEVTEEIATLISVAAEQYGTTVGGKKGNVQITSYDGRFKILVAIAETLVFGEQLQVAKGLIDECVKDWRSGSRDEVVVLLNDAFQVDQAGRINTGRILSLRKLQIDDPRWRSAMQAITDSLQVAGTKAYIRIYERAENGEYQPVSLDLAAL